VTAGAIGAEFQRPGVFFRGTRVASPAGVARGSRACAKEPHMTRPHSTLALTAFSFLLAAAALADQSKTITGDTKTVSGIVEQIDTSARTLTINTGNEYETISAPNDVKGFSTVKVGDKLTLRYYDNVVLTLKKPGDPDVAGTSGRAVTPGKPGETGTVAEQTTITATITAIDEKVPSITFTGPNNWTYSSKVQDRKALSRVKVGDKVDITWTKAVLVSLEPGS
jgi:hypothetical protein